MRNMITPKQIAKLIQEDEYESLDDTDEFQEEFAVVYYITEVLAEYEDQYEQNEAYNEYTASSTRYGFDDPLEYIAKLKVENEKLREELTKLQRAQKNHKDFGY